MGFSLFERPHHQRIANLLEAMAGPTLVSHQCLFGGGTVMALRFGEYRESRDVDFLMSSINAYREVRGFVTSSGIESLFTRPVKQLREVRMDQYGIRTMLEVEGHPIKFEILLEARIKLDAPRAEDILCGVPTLTENDMVTEKLLANSDRWADESVACRDVIDLAMMLPDGKIPGRAFDKASQAYSSIAEDLQKAVDHAGRDGRLVRCMHKMQMTMPSAQLLGRINKLRVPRPLNSQGR